MISEKHTYTHNGNLIFIEKIKCDKGDNTIKYAHYTNLITHESGIELCEFFNNAIKTIDSTEFFQLWAHFNNWKDKDYEYARKFGAKVIDKLATSKIELHGNGKFEDYDLRHIDQMFNFNNGMFDTYREWKEELYSLFDGGYLYHNVFSEDKKKYHDMLIDFFDVLASSIRDEIDNDILSKLATQAETIKDLIQNVIEN
jgi:hypothetical protein